MEKFVKNISNEYKQIGKGVIAKMDNPKEEKNCSIVMATYNGEKYIKEQIESILNNMTENDELIISDDGSKDKTLQIINEYMEKDIRINLISGPCMGVKKNFENAIKNAKGQYIFLADQDDIWMKDKIQTVLKTFKKEECSLVIHDAHIVNEKLENVYQSFFEYRNSGKGIIKNIWKNTYIGCCMAFSSDLKNKILPIPQEIEMHDQWIGIISEMKGKGSFFLNKKLIQYRRHGENMSKMEHYGFRRMLKNRINLIVNLIKNRGIR